jgi:hypothetical protein
LTITSQELINIIMRSPTNQGTEWINKQAMCLTIWLTS